MDKKNSIFSLSENILLFYKKNKAKFFLFLTNLGEVCSLVIKIVDRHLPVLRFQLSSDFKFIILFTNVLYKPYHLLKKNILNVNDCIGSTLAMLQY